MLDILKSTFDIGYLYFKNFSWFFITLIKKIYYINREKTHLTYIIVDFDIY